MVAHTLASILFPSFCALCSVRIEQHHVLCSRCNALCSPAPISFFTIGARRVAIHAAASFVPPLSMLAQGKGYGQHRNSVVLGKLLAQYCKQSGLYFDSLIPIPLHWSRQMLRGYNQAALIAEQLQEQGTLLQPLQRVRMTASQKDLDKKARQKNMRDAFAIKWWWSHKQVSQALSGKRIALIDDVYTSGATTKEAARLLFEHGAASVTILTACRVCD
jgi:ComF family protein